MINPRLSTWRATVPIRSISREVDAMEAFCSNLKDQKMQRTLSLLKDVLAEVAPVLVTPAELRDDANLYQECGIDSIASVELFLAIEERFNISFNEAELNTSLFHNLTDLARFVDSKSPDV
jgi:acyl carrier protein